MKNKSIVKTIFIASVVLFLLFSSLHPIFAQFQYKNQEKIPGAEPTSEFIPYLQNVINFGFAIIGILALFMLIIGAYQYLMAAGGGKAEGAKETISSALLGLVLGLCAWVILNKINPDLVNMRGITQITGGNIASLSQTTPVGGGTALTSDLSKVNCETVRNYKGFMNNNLSSLYNENIKSAEDLRNALANFRTTAPNGLTKYADLIYQTCTDKDNPVPFWYMMATFAQESSMFSEGTKGCSGYYNPGCMMKNGKYIKYDTPEEGIKANIANMSRLLKANPTPLGTWNAWYWPDRPDNNNENCKHAQEYLDKFSQAAKATGLSGI